LNFATIDRALSDPGESRSAEAPLRERFANAPWPEVVCWIGARLARGFYLMLAASAPMLSVAVLVGIGSEMRFALGLPGVWWDWRR
jgi:hypothetical protein